MKTQLALIVLCLPFLIFGQNAPSNNEQEIRQFFQEYVDTFNQHNFKELAQFWADDATYTNPMTQASIQGRDAIANEMKNWFEDAQVDNLKARVVRVFMTNDNQATARGVFHLSFKDAKPAVTNIFQAELEKNGDNWQFKKIQQVRQDPSVSHEKELEKLSWLIGEWESKDSDVALNIETKWDIFKNFLVQNITVNIFDLKALEARQIIAWDPVSKEIKSWMFDSDGGFGTGKWYQKEDSWFVDSAYTLPDGRKASAINIYTPSDKNSFEWESEGRDINGEILPNIEPITVERKASK